MHEPINIKSPNNISEWQMGFNSAFKGLIGACCDNVDTSGNPPVDFTLSERKQTSLNLML
jgi:hypothetical protein